MVGVGNSSQIWMKIKSRMEGNTTLYIVAAIVILHFIAGFGLLIYKMSGPVKKEEQPEDPS
jgi:hypothetical protein